MTYSIAIGGSLGLGYGLTSLIMAAIAMRMPRAFMAIALGGIMVRMAVGLALVVLISSRLPVLQAPFFFALLITFAISLTLEVALLHRGTLQLGKT